MRDTQVTMTEINAAYNAFAQTGAPPKPNPEFPELQLSYTDFSLWQRGRVQPGGGLESQVCSAPAKIRRWSGSETCIQAKAVSWLCWGTAVVCLPEDGDRQP